jgi:uncharacterized protein YecE (DUF72 family)
VTLRAGTSGFAFKEWKGTFYPEKMKNEDMLPFFATRFPTVEINNTFYRLPKENVLLEWASAVPETFTFAVKASQHITHFARLKPESFGALGFLLQNVRVMGARLGPVLFQLPPNLQADVERLRVFLNELPDDLKFAVEFRHESWFDESIFSALRDKNVAMVVAESAEFKCPVVSTADWGYLRLHRFDYDDAMLRDWAQCVTDQKWNDTFVYFKHDEGIGSGPPAVHAFLRCVLTCLDNGG